MTLFIPKFLHRLHELTADPNGRYALTGIRVLDLQDGRYRLEATDGRRPMIVHGPSLAPATGAKETFAALESVANGGTEALVPASDWKTGLKMGAKKVDRVGLVINPDLVTMACGEQTLSSKPVEGRFPDINGVLPKTPPLVRIQVNPQMMAGLLDVFAAVQPENGVTLLWYGVGRPLGLMAQGAEGLYLDALLMPLT